jgi:hypothetical protein
MKRLLFITSLLMVFGLVGFAQNSTCDKNPEIVDEYSASMPGSQKSNIQNFSDLLKITPKCVATIRILSKSKDDFFRQIKRFEKAFVFTQFPIDRLTYSIDFNNQQEKIQYWINLPNAIIPECEDCIIIRGKDFSKILELFRPEVKKQKR